MKTFSHALTIFCLAFLAAAAAGTGAPAQTAWSAPGGGASPYTQPGCAQLIGDGGFEAGNVWQLGPTSLAPEYVTYARHGGDYALALGITRGGNKQGFSSARQTVTIPATATKVTLAFWAYTMVEGFGDGDSMQLVLLHPDGSIRDELWDATEDSRLWNQHIFDLTRWRGQTLQVYFNVYNDGVGGTVGMFLDDASLTVCPAPGPTATLAPPPTHTPGITPPWPTLSPTRTPTSSPTPAPTPTPTATATATPLPPFCRDLVQNGGFEAELPPWEAGPATLPAQRAPWPVYHAAWSLRLGTQAANIRSHSPVRQVITLPSAQQVTLSFYVLAWSESLSGDDLQEALIYAADATLLKVAWQILSHEGSWRRIEADLSPYRGQTIQLLFNVYNDGLNGRAAIFLDDVSLVACALDLASLSVARAAAPAVVSWPDLDKVPVSMVVPPEPSQVRVQGAQFTATPVPSFTPLMTRIALAPLPSTPTAPPPVIIPATPTPTPRPGLWERLSSGAISQWPAGWQAAILGGIVLLILVLAWLVSQAKKGS